MNYRTLFFEFLSNYREYHFDTFQLLVFDNNDDENILKVINNKESVDVYQVKNAQTFYKKVHFNDLSGTVANLLFLSNQPTILEISKVDNDLRKYCDLYNNKPIYDLNCKYLLIYPIYKEDQLLGGFFIYSNYQIIWQIQQHKVFQLLNDLVKANCFRIINEISNQAVTKYWIFKNKGLYISDYLSNTLACKQYNLSFNVQGYSLLKIEEFNYENGIVEVFEPVSKQPIKSIIELSQLKVKNYTLIYTRAQEDEDLGEHVLKIRKIIDKIDGNFGSYNLYHTYSNSITLVFEKEISKKEIYSIFAEVSFIMIRSGNEVKKNIEFSILIDYLNLSPIEEFNYQYFDYYYNNLLLEKKNQILSNYTTSKIQITPLISAITMQISGYYIKDLNDLKNGNKENKLKSIKAIEKIIEEYKNYNIYIELSLLDLMNGSRVHIAYLNVLKKLVENNHCYLIIDYDKTIFYEISKLWNDFIKYIIVKESKTAFIEILTINDRVSGIYLSSEHYLNLISNSEKVGLELTNYSLNCFKQVIVKTEQTNITKYNNKNVLLLCMGV